MKEQGVFIALSIKIDSMKKLVFYESINLYKSIFSLKKGGSDILFSTQPFQLYL